MRDSIGSQNKAQDELKISISERVSVNTKIMARFDCLMGFCLIAIIIGFELWPQIRCQDVSSGGCQATANSFECQTAKAVDLVPISGDNFQLDALDKNQTNLLSLDYSILDEPVNEESQIFSDDSSGRRLWRRQLDSESSLPFGDSLMAGQSSQSVDYDSYQATASQSFPVPSFEAPVPQHLKRSRFSFGFEDGISQARNEGSSAKRLVESSTGSSHQSQKMAPQFIKEPPNLIHYLNSSDLVIPCVASGQPTPSVTWWHQNRQLEMGSLLDKRYVRYDNSLVISAFKEHDYQPEIHSGAYKCQASNPWGTIVSRDVVINAVIDREQELTVGDQFVTVDNDALFRCQWAPQSRDLFQVIGWLEDGQHLIQAPTSHSSVWPAQVMITDGFARQKSNQNRQLTFSQDSRAMVLADGQLLIQRVQLKDANKSFRCQVKNLLNSRVSLSSVSGRLFVTDASESGTSPRIVEAPKAISSAKLNEQLLLTCLAQGSPRPSIRWFRQPANDGHGGQMEWLELNADQLDPATGSLKLSASTNKRFAISPEANFLLLKSVQLTDDRCKFKCLANNSFGMHAAETELRLDLWPQSELVNVEPKFEFIENGINSLEQQQPVTFNCTIRSSSSQSAYSPIVAIEWLKNGKLLFGVSLAQYVQNIHRPYDLQEDSNQLESIVNNMNFVGFASGNTSAHMTSIFDDPNQELVLIENHRLMDTYDIDSPVQESESTKAAAQRGDLTSSSQNHLMVTQTTINKIISSSGDSSDNFRLSNGIRPRQKLKLVAREQLLYQLHFAQVRRVDRGSYQCRARSLQTTIQSSTQLMLKDNPPKFTETFQSQLIDSTTNAMMSNSAVANKVTHTSQPQTTSLKCIASGSPLPEISWTLSGFPVPESSRFRVGDYVTRDGSIVSFVNITNAQPEDGGLYECTAVNDVGQATHSAWLNVTGPVQIRPMPNVSAIAGRSLSIMCPVGGWPIEQISWFQNSTKLPINHRQKLSQNGTLLISDLNEVTDSGRYSCQAKQQQSAGDSLATSHVQVNINVPPVVEPFSFAKSLHRGQRYKVMCTVVRGDLPVSIRWFKDGRAIESSSSGGVASQLVDSGDESSSSSGGIAITQLDPYSSTLTFGSLQAHHRGQYSCEAANEAGRANQSSSLVIHVPPEWRLEPKDMSVTVGKTAVIDCQADAFPAARIEWRLSQDLFKEPPSEFKPISSSLYTRVFENGSLIIYNSQRSDAGYYLCQATNGVGPGLSRVIKLKVHVAAHFKSKIRTELVRRGHSARLKCESIGDPPIEINWLKDKMPLYSSEEIRYSISKTPISDGIISELNIADCERSDSALFTCISQNQFGSDDTNIQLLVQSVPDPPLDIRIHEYESRSVKISWLLGHTGNSPITKFVISYVQSSQLNSRDIHTPSNPLSGEQVNPLSQNWQLAPPYTNITVAGNESSIVLQGLTPVTEYQFFMVAYNALGSSKPPNEPIKFRTDDEAPSAPPQLVKASAINSRSLRVRWKSPERRAHFGTVSGYYVGYKLVKPANKSPPDSNSDHQTAETFIFKTVDLANNQGLVTASGNRSQTGEVALAELECQLTGLKRGQKYLVTVQAFNSRGAGPSSEAIMTETWRIDVPDPPILRMITRTSRSIHLAWRLVNSQLVGDHNSADGQQVHKIGSRRAYTDGVEPSGTSKSTGDSQLTSNDLDVDASERLAEEEQASEPITGFILTRKQVQPPKDDQQQAVEMRVPSDHMSQIVDNLTCGTKYQFSIVALNSVGASPPSEPLVVKTEGSTPVAPDRSSLLSLNSSAVIINLAAWHNGACPMRSFDVLFKPSRSKKWLSLTNYQVNNENGALKGESTSLAQRSTYSHSQNSPANSNNQRQNLANSTIVLDDLSASINYDLKILATNEAGSTEALYTFNTNGNWRTLSSNLADDQWTLNGATGDFQLPDANLTEMFNNSGLFLPWILFLMLVSLVMSAGCFLVVRRRHVASSTCSLSLSSASRSNQSSSNYYSTSNAAAANSNQQQSVGQQFDLDQHNLKVNCNLTGTSSGIAPVSPRCHTLGKHYQTNDDSSMTRDINTLRHLGDIYGQRSGDPHLKDNSNYVYLANQKRTGPSPPSTELTSVINGSEAEMCLGASALDMTSSRTHDQKLRCDSTRLNNQSNGYYMAPMMHQPTNQVKNQLSKSSTLPSSSHQQILQQLIQQHATGDQSNQQEAIDSLMAANIIHNQQQQAAAETCLAIQAAAVAAANQTNETLAGLMEQQLQQQVYATVKRGCPRPPRLCDYSIYQCPTNRHEPQQLEPVMRCCNQPVAIGDLHQINSYQQSTSSNQQQDQDCQQEHQLASDYQQLRPIQ